MSTIQVPSNYSGSTFTIGINNSALINTQLRSINQGVSLEKQNTLPDKFAERSEIVELERFDKRGVRFDWLQTEQVVLQIFKILNRISPCPELD